MTRRTVHMTGLEPRTMGGLKGWGFTVTFTEPAGVPADQSTAARKDVPLSSEAKLAPVVGAVEAEIGEAHIAGTQAPPVDTHSSIGAHRGVEGEADSGSASPANFPRVPFEGYVK